MKVISKDQGDDTALFTEDQPRTQVYVTHRDSRFARGEPEILISIDKDDPNYREKYERLVETLGWHIHSVEPELKYRQYERIEEEALAEGNPDPEMVTLRDRIQYNLDPSGIKFTGTIANLGAVLKKYNLPAELRNAVTQKLNAEWGKE